VPPSSLEAERAVLGGVLLENSAMNVLLEILDDEDFYSEANAQIFRSMKELFGRGAPIDSITLRDEVVSRGKLQAVGGDEYLLQLTDVLPTVSNIESHAKIIREKSVVRRLIMAAHEVAARGYSDYGEFEQFLDQSEKAVFEVAKTRVRNPHEHIKQVIIRTFQQIQLASQSGERITGLPSGFERLDNMTAGMHPGDLIIVAGRPGMGKTSFALNIATYAALKNGTSCAVFSLEMARDQLVRRMLASEARVDQGRLRQGVLSSDEMDRLIQAAGMLAETPMFVDDTGALPVMELRAKARRLKSEANLGLVIVDYLQLMRGPKNVDNREQEISYISQSLKALAKELDIPVVALSQLNRSVENRPGKDKRPQLSDLRESGAIEQDADIIMFVYRDEVYNRDDDATRGLAEIIIGKQRNGPVGVVPCRFFHEFTRFENLADDRDFG